MAYQQWQTMMMLYSIDRIEYPILENGVVLYHNIICMQNPCINYLYVQHFTFISFYNFRYLFVMAISKTPIKVITGVSSLNTRRRNKYRLTLYKSFVKPLIQAPWFNWREILTHPFHGLWFQWSLDERTKNVSYIVVLMYFQIIIHCHWVS